MIKSFADKRTAAIFRGDEVLSVSETIQPTVRRKLLIIEAAASLEDLRSPPGNRLETLKGKRKGQWSIRVNDQWRICFRWDNGEVFDVELTDYHS